MISKLIALFFFVILHQVAIAKVFPIDKMELNFTQIMFEYDDIAGANNYSIQIIPTNKKVGNKTIFLKNKSLAILVTEGLRFGENYTWFFTAFQNEKKIFTSKLFNFSITASNLVAKENYKYSITKNDKKYNQHNIFFLDFLGVAINRKGEPIWYLPRNKEKLRFEDSSRRSLRITESGTFTYLDNITCYDKDIFGNTIWAAPKDGQVSGDTTEQYHHDFRKLPYGNYMACSYKYISEPNYYDATKNWTVRYNTLIEYDKEKKAVWSWIEKDHLDDKLLAENGDASITDFPGSHLNGFDYNEKQDALVLSFRNTSRILKIDHKTKEVQYELGRYNLNKPHNKSDEYTISNQHGPAWMPDGSVIIFNNNFGPNKEMEKGANPHILIIEEPKDGKQEKKVWDYECKSDSFPEGQRGKEGYAYTMHTGNILVCQGSSNRVFEVNKNKQIVWENFCFQYNKKEQKWESFQNYRSFAATSLYPTYFTLQKLYNANNGVIKNEIVLNNEGTDDKEFIIETYLITNEKILNTERIFLKANTNKVLKYNQKNKGYIKTYPLHSNELYKIINF
jgi:hypothetical protein